MEIKLKRVPFDIELAKKITEGKIKGAKVMTANGSPTRIISFDKKGVFCIVAFVYNEKKDSEDALSYTTKGTYYQSESSLNDIQLYVPVSYNDYSNFVPQKWQPCLVRDSSLSPWTLRVATGRNNTFMLPINKKTIQLLGSTKSYEQLLEEQWTNEE